MPLTADETREAYRRINVWRAAPSEPVACPACNAPGLVVVDRSSRPYAEWYALSCAVCGLSVTLNVPMSAPQQSYD